jgi:hypothetical protein
MLSLDSPRWSELSHVYGSAADIPSLLRQLQSLPSSENDRDLGSPFGARSRTKAMSTQLRLLRYRTSSHAWRRRQPKPIFRSSNSRRGSRYVGKKVTLRFPMTLSFHTAKRWLSCLNSWRQRLAVSGTSRYFHALLLLSQRRRASLLWPKRCSRSTPKSPRTF